jgi:hypothetical protein
VQVYYRVGERTEAQFVCECSDSGCVEKVLLTRAEYADVRDYPTRFFLVPGHENETVDRVVHLRSASPSSKKPLVLSVGTSRPRGVEAATQKEPAMRRLILLLALATLVVPAAAWAGSGAATMEGPAEVGNHLSGDEGSDPREPDQQSGWFAAAFAQEPNPICGAPAGRPRAEVHGDLHGA